HHIAAPLTSCASTARLARDITALLGAPKISPVWIARFMVMNREPAGAPREPSARRTRPVYGATYRRLRPPGVRSSGYLAEIAYVAFGAGTLTEIGFAPGSACRAIAIAASGVIAAAPSGGLIGGNDGRPYIARGAVPVRR